MKTRWLLVVVALVALVAGYFLGTYRARRLACRNFGVFMRAQQEMEIRRKENAAFYAYLDEPPAVAAWALETLIDAYQRYTSDARAITGESGTDYGAHEMFAHARLYKVYSSLNMPDKARMHLDRAVSLSDGHDADDLMRLVELLDKLEKKANHPWAVPWR